MSETVTVKSVDGEGNPWQHGITYYPVTFDRNGQDFRCSWGKKGDPPAVGETVEGDFRQQNGEWKFSKASKPQGGGGGSSDYGSNGSKKGREWKPESQYDPEKTARIGRAHAQHMALRFVAFAQITVTESDLSAWCESKLRPVIDWFEADVDKAATAVGAGRIPDAPPTAPAASQPPDDTHQAFVHFLTEAGENDLSASLVANWLMSADPVDGALTAKQQDEALTQLQNPETRSGARDKLRAAYVKANGELPAATPAGDLDDLPF